jgi:hypothetical protein
MLTVLLYSCGSSEHVHIKMQCKANDAAADDNDDDNNNNNQNRNNNNDIFTHYM